MSWTGRAVRLVAVSRRCSRRPQRSRRPMATFRGSSAVGAGRRGVTRAGACIECRSPGRLRDDVIASRTCSVIANPTEYRGDGRGLCPAGAAGPAGHGTPRAVAADQPSACGARQGPGRSRRPGRRCDRPLCFDPAHPADHEVRFTCGVPSRSRILSRRKPKFPLQDRHFRAPTRRSGRRAVNGPG